MDLAIHLDRTSTTPLYQQLTEKIRTVVLEGRLKPNQKLPSSRNLAKSLNISRSTVTQSYEQLESEGYLETRRGSGTYICQTVPDQWLNSQPIEPVTTKIDKDSTLSQFGTNLISIGSLKVSESDYEISFRYGDPAVEYFPMQQWRKFLARHCENSTALLNYAPDAAGHFPLRVEIADYLGRSRAVRCTPEQIIIINGSQQALDLIARLILDSGDWVAMEEPGYLGARHCFLAQSAYIQPIAVNSEGLSVEYLRNYRQKFKFVYVTPSHQFPTGVTLSLSQRIALLQWAEKTDTLIIEDDYDSEYRYGEKPIPALQGMDRSQSVIYIGTFSKILFPSLRIGYLVVPPVWIPIFCKAKWLCDRFCPILEQYALTDWIGSGHFERHIRRMRHLYHLRRQALIQAFEKYFGDRVTILGANAGIHLMVKIQTALPDNTIIQKAAAVGVGLISARRYYLQPQHQGEFIFGYAQLEEAQIEQGIKKLSQVLKS
ncbi:Transcriptional regulator with HTH domain and aminotransferase domain [Hyella patelloides LEGE 07179]|uniref:Transcriptional regulator with HTH domain and aminotransferase domain n=1 Tax=Hyella patelloides LEGE 07179 TaxID=945734 RepID=A0A563W457_9CYAN|nr:PLP-dependent aminotransferase family protein [Hyella patelloides]VEP18430.1 Transcriptional regulator with HTH domain and aminotransferase domain [Hyella patelloides LEGE 07179]